MWKVIANHKDSHPTEHTIVIVHVPHKIDPPKDGICSYCKKGKLEEYTGKVSYGYKASEYGGGYYHQGPSYGNEEISGFKCNHCDAYIWRVEDDKD